MLYDLFAVYKYYKHCFVVSVCK